MSSVTTTPFQRELFTWQDTAHSGASLQRKELADWQPPLEPADAELLPELGTLVARSRDLGRNHGIASSGFQTQVDCIVGTGLRLAAKPDYRTLGKDIEWAKTWSRNTETRWRAYAQSTYFDAARKLTFDGATALVLRTVMMNGEVLVLPLWIEDRQSRFATTFQLVEGDRLSNPDFRTDDSHLRGGIEIDDFGKSLAYYLRRSTQEDWMMGGWFPVGASWERIPAETSWGRKRVIHIFQVDRIGQSRGKPMLTAVLEQFKMFDHYQRTELQSAIVNALVAGVIETPMDQAQISELMGGDPNSYLAMKNEWPTRLRGGAMIPLYPGDKLSPFAPSRPATQYPAFVETVLRHISAGLHMPYELLLKDFSKTNYSSARASLLEAWRFFLDRRKWLAEQWATPAYRLWLEEAVQKGEVEAPGYYEDRALYEDCRWIGPGRGWIDPVKEAQAAAVRIQTRISTLEMECAEQGLDYQDVLEQIALEKSMMQELGIWVDPVPAKGAQQKPSGNAAAIGSGTAQGGEPDAQGEG